METKDLNVKTDCRYHYLPHITIGAKSVDLVLNDKDGNTLFNGARSPSVHGIDFSEISEISRFSWMAAEKRLPVHELKKELSKSQALDHHPRIIILCFVSLAVAAFCYTFGTDYIDVRRPS